MAASRDSCASHSRRCIVELGGRRLGDLPADDRQFVVDLGLARRDPAGGL